MSQLQSKGISVVLVDDHAVVREGYRRLLERTEETLPAQVAIKQPRTLLAESLRFPEQG